MLRPLLLAVMLTIACGDGALPNRAVPGRRLPSTSGRFIAVVTQPAADQISFRIDVGETTELTFTGPPLGGDRPRATAAVGVPRVSG